MSEAIKRVGRGGAGNYAAAQQKPGDKQDDLEAQRRNSNPNEISGASLEGTRGKGDEPSYVRTGRGGAGNLTSANDGGAGANALEASAAAARRASANNTPVGASSTGGGFSKPPGTGAPASTAASAAGSGNNKNSSGGAVGGGGGDAAAAVTGPSAAPMTRGRGGAGNYAGAAEDERERQRREDERDRQARDRVRREVEAKVDGVLKPPGKAVVSQGKAKAED